MGLSKVYSRAVQGMQAPQVIVEVHVANGLPGFSIVGLPDTIVRESRDRVRSAIQMSGFEFPARRITVNLAPADLPKDSGRYDLPIALGILLASGLVTSKLDIDNYEIAGELALDGMLRKINGALAIAYNANSDKRRFILPIENSLEAGLVEGIIIYPAASLRQVVQHFTGERVLDEFVADKELDLVQAADALNLSQVRGQVCVKQALEIAAGGRHSLLMVGNPGCGKSMLAQRFTTILPALDSAEAIQTAAIYSQSVGGFDVGDFGKVPFRQPHHSSTMVALAGGGRIPKPGEISLAHNGVLFLDEVAEFDRQSIEILREPLETKKIHLSRARHAVIFPADFQLLAAMNPCPCGNYGHSCNVCQCTSEQISRYRARLSAPFLDRIDLVVEMPYLKAEELGDLPMGEDSQVIRERVTEARALQQQRQGKLNYALSNQEVETYCLLEANAKQLLLQVVERQYLSARVYFKLLKTARTIADLAHKKRIEAVHIGQAAQYKKLF